MIVPQQNAGLVRTYAKAQRSNVVYADTADADTLMRMDDELIRRNISPGGSADLLAAALMLYFAENDL